MAKKQAQRRPAPAAAQNKKTSPAPVRRTDREKRPSIFAAGSRDMIFGRQNMILFGAGLLLILLGLLTMAGGAMPDPNTWDPDIIYSFRRITLAPILMVAGFVVIIIGIFRKTGSAVEGAPDDANSESA